MSVDSDRAERSATGFAVARTSEIPCGERRIVTVRGHSIGVFNVNGEFYALLNRCPHQGAELCKGVLQGDVASDRPGELRFDGGTRLLRCPWHGWEFDIKTGRSYFDPKRTRVRAYPTSVEAGGAIGSDGRVEGRFQAETVPVSVEDDYVVIHLRR
jgi:3-phenylpropionate/trans-cinnamate dioxygenase ferredoxin subunit